MVHKYTYGTLVKVIHDSGSPWEGQIVVIQKVCDNIYGQLAYKVAIDHGSSFCPAASLVDEGDLCGLGILDRLKILRRFPRGRVPIRGVELVHELELL